VDALAERLAEIDELGTKVKGYQVFSTSDYAGFKRLYLCFTGLSEEFQLLSVLAEKTFENFESAEVGHWTERRSLEEYFRRLQIPMLRQLIGINLQMLRVWDDRLRSGEGLPYGLREAFIETVRIINTAKIQMIQPRYIGLLDEAALVEADRADRLLQTLISEAPGLFDFTEQTPEIADDSEQEHPDQNFA
jgi:hypothetical protein